MEHQKTSSRIYHVPEEKMKSKQSRKMRVKGCAEGHHHRECNHKVELSLHIIPSYALMGSCLMNVMDYNFNYKLRSVVGREDDFTANKWTWFDIQVCASLMWIWMISQALIDYTNMGRIIGGLLDNVQALYVSASNNNGTITS